MNLLSYDEIIRMFLIATVVMIGFQAGYFMVRYGVIYSISKEDEIIKDLEEALRVLDVR